MRSADEVWYRYEREGGVETRRILQPEPGLHTDLLPRLKLVQTLRIVNHLGPGRPTEMEASLRIDVPGCPGVVFGYWQWGVAGREVLSSFVYRADGTGRHEAAVLAKARLIDWIHGRLDGESRNYVSVATVRPGGDIPLDMAEAQRLTGTVLN